MFLKIVFSKKIWGSILQAHAASLGTNSAVAIWLAWKMSLQFLYVERKGTDENKTLSEHGIDINI